VPVAGDNVVIVDSFTYLLVLTSITLGLESMMSGNALQ